MCTYISGYIYVYVQTWYILVYLCTKLVYLGIPVCTYISWYIYVYAQNWYIWVYLCVHVYLGKSMCMYKIDTFWYIYVIYLGISMCNIYLGIFSSSTKFVYFGISMRTYLGISSGISWYIYVYKCVCTKFGAVRGKSVSARETDRERETETERDRQAERENVYERSHCVCAHRQLSM